MSGPSTLEDRRTRLVAACDLERVNLRLAWQDVRGAVAPEVGARRARPWVLRTIGYALPLIGYRRMGTALRFAAVGLAVWRAVSSWRARRR